MVAGQGLVHAGLAPLRARVSSLDRGLGWGQGHAQSVAPQTSVAWPSEGRFCRCTKQEPHLLQTSRSPPAANNAAEGVAQSQHPAHGDNPAMPALTGALHGCMRHPEPNPAGTLPHKLQPDFPPHWGANPGSKMCVWRAGERAAAGEIVLDGREQQPKAVSNSNHSSNLALE